MPVPKEVLGLWVAQQEGAKFWLQVLTESGGLFSCLRSAESAAQRLHGDRPEQTAISECA
jgi:hypothetical protein